MIKNLTLAIMAAAALTLSACATPTPYGPALTTSGYNPGYSDMKLEDGRYRITFAGNDLTKRETVENYLLYRAAELTLDSGYDWFEIVNRGTDEKTRTVSDPIMDNFSWRFYRGSRWGAWGFGWDDMDRESIQYTRYEATAEIVMHKGDKADAANAYDARSVKANLDSSIVRPTTH
ncbi:MAG: hypothetical protein WDN06_04055 [Asticcacaulis sp.]